MCEVRVFILDQLGHMLLTGAVRLCTHNNVTSIYNHTAHALHQDRLTQGIARHSRRRTDLGVTQGMLGIDASAHTSGRLLGDAHLLTPLLLTLLLLFALMLIVSTLLSRFSLKLLGLPIRLPLGQLSEIQKLLEELLTLLPVPRSNASLVVELRRPCIVANVTSACIPCTRRLRTGYLQTSAKQWRCASRCAPE